MGLILVGGAKPVWSPDYSGQGYLAGTLPSAIVTVNGIPSPRPLECRHRKSRLTITVVMSNPDGSFRINGMDPLQEYEILARDTGLIYNDVVISRVKGKPY